MPLSRRRALHCVRQVFALCALTTLTGLASAQPPSNTPIKLLVGFPAGAGTDAIARTLGEKLKDELGAPVVVENRAGAGGNVGSEACARNAPADYTVAEGRGCHSKATSELDPGLVYQDEKEVYGEVMKWQKPVKDGYEQIKGGVERVSKLLEVTALPYEKQTQIRLLLDKATEVSDLIEKDGSWGAHASHYLQDRVKSALSYVDQAQTLLDKGGY